MLHKSETGPVMNVSEMKFGEGDFSMGNSFSKAGGVVTICNSKHIVSQPGLITAFMIFIWHILFHHQISNCTQNCYSDV